MKSGLVLSIFMILCVISISGCGTLDAKNQADKLERSLIHYASALRWGRHREAISFHIARDGKTAEVYLDHIEQFSVTSFEYISKKIIPSSEKEGITEAVIVAEMSYFHKEQGTIRKLQLNQIWWYNKDIKRWLVETDFPEFK
ncbi:MAG: hypothetical protein KAJ03_03410 [Gammaproteobacteria bacterium]|nr:hypothetical protein [Gammaproteobacteria bacterium]